MISSGTTTSLMHGLRFSQSMFLPTARMHGSRWVVQAWIYVAAYMMVLSGIGCESIGSESSATTTHATHLSHALLGPIVVPGERMNHDPAIGQPIRLRVADRFLWVVDASLDPTLHVLDLETGQLVHSFGRMGAGPGEFASVPFALEVSREDPTAVWAFDGRLQRITRFEPRPPSEYEIRSVGFGGDKTVWRVAWVLADRIIGQTNSDDERFLLFSGDGARRAVAPGPLLGPSWAPREERLKASNTAVLMCSWPGRGFVIANGVAGRIEYYDTDARLVRLASVPFPSEAEFEKSANGGIRFVAKRRYYSGCATTSDYLYALFSGRSWAESEAELRVSGEFVHVFDWEGELRAVLQLDRPVLGIEVLPTGKYLYGGSILDASIYRFPIPPIRLPNVP